LSKLVFGVTMEWVPEAYKKNIDLGFEGASDDAMIKGDSTRLTRARQQPPRQRDSLQSRTAVVSPCAWP
jgi:hypothetical protein